MDFLLFSATAAGYLLYTKQTKQVNVNKTSCSELAVLLDKCPSLKEPLIKNNTTPILGLLFAASWCDDCWDVVPLIEKIARLPKNDVITIVYISSDRSETEMKNYQPDVFASIPYDAQVERSNLKRHFGVCAKKEMLELNMTESTRKYGTPTLILLDAETGRVLTETGVENVVENVVNQNPFDVLKSWKALL